MGIVELVLLLKYHKFQAWLIYIEKVKFLPGKFWPCDDLIYHH